MITSALKLKLPRQLPSTRSPDPFREAVAAGRQLWEGRAYGDD